MHKLSKRKYEWYRDLSNNPDNAHERRFEQLPYSGLPTMNSKHIRFNNSVDMKKEKGRDAKIVELNSHEIVQPVYYVQNDFEFEYDPNMLKVPITRHLDFRKGERFGNDGIFGDLFDSKKNDKFGKPQVSSINAD